MKEESIYYTKLQVQQMTIYVAATEKGLCFIGSKNGDLTEVEEWVKKARPTAKLVENQEKLALYITQLKEYFSGERKQFQLPIDVTGTDFQQSVWTCLQTIAYGKTTSYSEIANLLGKPTAVRAVGAAVGANPVLIVIPCHRVISKSGKLTGFRGGLDMKKQLLCLEKSKS